MSTVRTNQLSARTGTGTITIPSGNYLNAPGHVIQVKQTVYTGQTSTSIGNGWYSLTDLNCSITPVATTSKILVNLSLCYAALYYQYKVRLTRNSSVVTGALGGPAGSRPQSWLTSIWYDAGATGTVAGQSTYNLEVMNGMYLDSPASASELTYGIDIGGYTTSYPVYVNRSYTFQSSADYDATPISTLTLWEIGA